MWVLRNIAGASLNIVRLTRQRCRGYNEQRQAETTNQTPLESSKDHLRNGSTVGLGYGLIQEEGENASEYIVTERSSAFRDKNTS